MQTGAISARHAWTRRGVLNGLALAFTPGAGAAQDQSVEAAPALSQEAALSANLLTRMGALVRLNGRHRAVLVLDTGAECSALATDLAAQLALPSAPPVLVHGVTTAAPAPTVAVERLSFGGRYFYDLKLPVFERRLMAADGLLGLDVLSKFRLSLDLEQRRVSLAPSGPEVFAEGSASAIATRLPGETRAVTGPFGQLIQLNTVVDGVPTAAFVDSGAQYSIGNLALAQATGADLGGRVLPIYGVTGQTSSAVVSGVRDLRIGHSVLGATPLLFADLHAFEALGLADRPALLLGADILYRFRRVVLDYGRGRMAFGALRRFYVPPPPIEGGTIG